MKPYEIQDSKERKITLRCKHEKDWPPVHVRLGQDIEDQRAMNLIDEHKYEQIKTWQRVCGLMEMGDKCQSCPYCFQENKRGTLTPWVNQGRVLPPFVKVQTGKDPR